VADAALSRADISARHTACRGLGVASSAASGLATSRPAAKRVPQRLASTLAMLLTVAGLLLAASASMAQTPNEAQALHARYGELREALAQSPFQRPLVLQSGTSDSAPQGDVYAVMEQPFPALAAALREPASWCAILLLQTNVKRCSPEGDAAEPRLEVRIARKYTDSADEAHRVVFAYRVQAAQPDYLRVELSAYEGPVGTRHYRLQFEAVPVDASRVFVHLSYAYEAGLAARLATRAYLASAGRDKVGFSIAGHDASGRPVRVRGIQGVAERNTMRYFLAIEAFLATPAARLEERLRRFHAALERYPAQLHETNLDEYLAMKLAQAPSR
jgi:hypothetical protein